MEIDVLLLNAMVYIATFVYIYLKERRLSIYVLSWSIFTVVAIMGYVILFTGDWDINNPNIGRTLPITPYLFAYATLLLITHPFKGYEEKNLNLKILRPNPTIDKLCGVMIFAYVFLGAVTGITAYIVASTIGYGEAYEMVNEGGSEGTLLGIVLGKGLLFWIYRICCWIVIPTPFFIMYYLTKLHYDEKNWLRYFLFILLSQARPMCQALIGGSKGALFFLLFNVIFYFVLFRKNFSSTLQSRIKQLMVPIIFMFGILAVTITSSRIENKQGFVNSAETKNSLFSYLGQPFPNLGYYYYDKINKHPYGRRFFPEFFNPNTEQIYLKNNMTRTEYWNSELPVPMEKFKTMWGDWYVEYGLLGSILGLFFMYLFFKKICFDYKYHIFCIPILAYYYEKVCMFAFATGTGIAGSDAHKGFLISALVSFLLYVYEKSNVQRTFIK